MIIPWNPIKNHGKIPMIFRMSSTQHLPFVAKYLSEFCGLAVIHRLRGKAHPGDGPSVKAWKSCANNHNNTAHGSNGNFHNGITKIN